MLMRVDSFKTDENGTPIAASLPELEPSSEYVICEERDAPPLGPRKSREEIAEWIDGCVFGDLRTLTLGVDQFFELKEGERNHPATGRPLGGCNFLLTAACFMALEYLAQIYGKGRKRSAMTVAREYVNDFLCPIDPRYSEIFDVLWNCFRNGIVHGSWPQAVQVRGEAASRIFTGANPCTDGEHLEPTSECRDPNFVVSGARLLADLEKSYDEWFRDWLLYESDDGVLLRAAPRLLEIKPGDKKRKAQLAIIRSWNDSR
jgi:hypothetical protein